MFGREPGSSTKQLLRHYNLEDNDSDHNISDISLTVTSSDIDTLNDARIISQKKARENIQYEQLKQKHTFDKKVKKNR